MATALPWSSLAMTAPYSAHGPGPPAVHPDALSTFYPKHVLFNPSGPLAIQVFTISKDRIASLKHLRWWHEHLLRREGSRVAVHMPCASAPT